MDWNTLIDQIGSNLPAVAIAALAFVAYRERNRNDTLLDRLIEQSNEHAKDAVRREQDVLNTLKNLEQAIRGGKL